ncbi:MAG: hypothetical protein RMM31_02335 [Anaerolineae bacterium]|nr:hypothetical protein [Thermoflexales bacterium]MDW8395060.1 hypothetical protein [Anaerolineae bacterium]
MVTGADSDDNLDGISLDLDALARAMVEQGLSSVLSYRQQARLLDPTWLRVESNRSIRLDISVDAALNRASATWLEVLCRANNLCARRTNRKTRVRFLLEAITDSEWLRARVRAFSGGAQVMLHSILDSGGWVRLADLSQRFGSARGQLLPDDWLASSLGELCLRGIVFLGKSVVRAEVRSARRADRVAVIPQDLRSRLRSVLEQSLSLWEEEWLSEVFSDPAQQLAQALGALERYFDLAEEVRFMPRRAARDFLIQMQREGHPPTRIWELLHVFLIFADRFGHEIRCPDDLCGYHLSEVATHFLDDMFSGRHTLSERRMLVYVVRRLYQHLHRCGEVSSETLKEIESAAARLLASRRHMPIIHRPPPLGGEVLLERLNPFTLRAEQVRHNHLRVALVCNSAFQGDWELMQAACALVVDGARKAALVAEVMALDPPTQEWLVAQGDAEDCERALTWFQEERVLDLSAW